MHINKLVIDFPIYSVKRDWLIAPSTYLVDSFEPFVEEVSLPEVSTKPGKLKLFYCDVGNSKYSGGFRFKFIKNLIGELILRNEYIDKPFIDLRGYSPGNIAHAIMIHLTLAIYSRDFAKSINISNPVLLFPKKLPHYINSLFNSIGFETILSNADFEGPEIKFELDSTNSLRGNFHEVIKIYFSDTDFDKKLLALHKNLPKKIFISRKDTRRLMNEQSVEKFLEKKGFKKVYLEDYPILEQVALVSLADTVVAIHGAALGPVVFRVLFKTKPLKLIEIYSPAHMTNVYRIIAHQINANWIGVRGRAWPKLIKQAYECEPSKVRQYSLNDFELCLISLENALNRINDED